MTRKINENHRMFETSHEFIPTRVQLGGFWEITNGADRGVVVT